VDLVIQLLSYILNLNGSYDLMGLYLRILFVNLYKHGSSYRDEYKEFEKLIQDDLQVVDSRMEEEEVR